MIKHLVNFKGELFTAAATSAGVAVVRLFSSVILTRLLYPEAFGLMTIVASIAFIVEMVSDVGIVGLTIRHAKGDEPQFFHTWWSVRFVRSLFNAGLMFLLAPYLAEWYGQPDLTLVLRIFSISFVLMGLESMSIPLSIRRRQTQKMHYIELGCLVLSTCFSIIWSYFSRDYFGILYGTLLNQLLMTTASYVLYTDSRAQFRFHREALREQFHFARYVMPSSMITLVVSQFDKLLFLKLFDLQLMGLYGLAVNILTPVDALITRLSRNMLYPRCAENFRDDESTFVEKYYTQSWKLHALVLAVPALLCGAGAFVVHVLYDSRYAQAGLMVQLFAMRSVIHVFSSTAEDLLVASGMLRVQLAGNVIRLLWLVPAVLLGSHYFGLPGFLAAMMLEMAPTLAYYLRTLSARGMVIWRYEGVRLLYTLGLVAVGALSAWVGGELLAALRAS
ncbi:oligosaccharide flippase family protein [Hydrogenophaga palleronii]|uniref:oligosaccharide flippase family protein n=1 Tax=Hydrogenophaga palleronii TaxID=65655 RepID=UPI000826B8B2|nr:oligosaccharide flippase family protein [Hydrogenophaga palleronii]